MIPMPSPPVDLALVRKHNRPGPRYTSYPTALQFRDDADPGHLIDAARAERGGLSLYFHLPFCESLCWFCGCNKVITSDNARADIYLDALEREMALFPEDGLAEREVVQLHFGGGTPNFLSPAQITRLGRALRSRFDFAADAECSVELDPRFLTLDQVRAFREIGMTRASFGIQDVNEEVQRAVHRVQSGECNERAFAWLRAEGFRSVNVDLIYGLPGQTPSSYAETLRRVLEYAPDRFAVFSYAHVPWMVPAQKILERSPLPDPGDKLAMLKLVIETLTAAGYVFIGMDHFALPDDELVRALEAKTLQRNFQGYSTRGGVEIRGFGVSAVSQTARTYRQNRKSLEQYYADLAAGRLPVERGLELGDEDVLRRHIIMRLMCDFGLEFGQVEQLYGILFAEKFSDSLAQLRSFAEDGLVELDERSLRVTEAGRLFIRNIAMCFDAYTVPGEGRHSKTI
ncbi:MAG: oxygen-independent coproporphyrinogen III oxidase [Chthoniobacterales bacterium]|nr:oxygen-independent coproporphyrinogen III oxidase [Chthoniobacterales bacterium]